MAGLVPESSFTSPVSINFGESYIPENGISKDGRAVANEQCHSTRKLDEITGIKMLESDAVRSRDAPRSNIPMHIH